MTREHLLMVLGALVLISPWSGLPMAWLEWVLVVLGLGILAVAYRMRNREGRIDLSPAAFQPPTPPVPPSQTETQNQPSTPQEPRRPSNIAFS